METLLEPKTNLRTSTPSTGQRLSVTVRVFCGANQTTLDVPPGTKVGAIRVTLASTLRIPQGAKPLVGGRNADEHTSVGLADEVEFIQLAGRLG